MRVLNYTFSLIEEERKDKDDIIAKNSAKLITKFFGIKEREAIKIAKAGLEDKSKGTKLFRQALKTKDKKSIGLGMIALSKFAFKLKRDPKVNATLSAFNKEQEKIVQEVLDPIILGAGALIAFFLLSRLALKLILIIGAAIVINPSLLDSLADTASNIALQSAAAAL